MDRKSKGGQKINMSKIENESNLQVTFSKRWFGLFKKASELSTLCGVEVGMDVFSPGNKVYSFGNPSVEAVMDQFLSRNPPSGDIMDKLVEAQRDVSVHEVNMHLTYEENMLASEKKRGETMNEIMKEAFHGQCWWTRPLNELRLQQLEVLKGTMVRLKENVANLKEQHMMNGALNPNPPIPVLFAATPVAFGGGVAGFDGGASGPVWLRCPMGLTLALVKGFIKQFSMME